MAVGFRTVGVRAAATGAAVGGVIVAGALVLGALVGPAAAAAAGAPPVAPPSSGPALLAPGPSVPRPWAPAATAAIHPGIVTVTTGGGACTSGFVFAGGGRTFLGQAAHCAGTGAASETDGCDSGTGPLGSPVTIRAADGTERAGTLSYSSWVTMQQNGESDPAVCAYNDFALVEIGPADVADVNPSIPLYGGPTGIDTDGLAVGEPVVTVGGPLGRSGAAPSASAAKVGVGAGDVGGGRSHEVVTTTPGLSGDSGSGVLDGSGAAIGILTTLTLDPLPVSSGVTDIARALAYANANGGLGDVELVLGTEPFSATPPGVPLTAVAPPAGPPLG